jgi:hypothetical protein
LHLLRGQPTLQVVLHKLLHKLRPVVAAQKRRSAMQGKEPQRSKSRISTFCTSRAVKEVPTSTA